MNSWSYWFRWVGIGEMKGFFVSIVFLQAGNRMRHPMLWPRISIFSFCESWLPSWSMENGPEKSRYFAEKKGYVCHVSGHPIASETSGKRRDKFAGWHGSNVV
jgi:hypothetical protein